MNEENINLPVLIFYKFSESMGQIKTLHIKNLAKELLEKYPDKFTNNYEKNKELMKKLVEMESKTIRNEVAGYIVHLIEKKEHPVGFEVILQAKEEKRRPRRGRRRR